MKEISKNNFIFWPDNRHFEFAVIRRCYTSNKKHYPVKLANAPLHILPVALYLYQQHVRQSSFAGLSISSHT